MNRKAIGRKAAAFCFGLCHCCRLICRRRWVRAFVGTTTHLELVLFFSAATQDFFFADRVPRLGFFLSIK